MQNQKTHLSRATWFIVIVMFITYFGLLAFSKVAPVDNLINLQLLEKAVTAVVFIHLVIFATTRTQEIKDFFDETKFVRWEDVFPKINPEVSRVLAAFSAILVISYLVNSLLKTLGLQYVRSFTSEQNAFTVLLVLGVLSLFFYRYNSTETRQLVDSKSGYSWSALSSVSLSPGRYPAPDNCESINIQLSPLDYATIIIAAFAIGVGTFYLTKNLGILSWVFTALAFCLSFPLGFSIIGGKHAEIFSQS